MPVLALVPSPNVHIACLSPGSFPIVEVLVKVAVRVGTSMVKVKLGTSGVANAILICATIKISKR